MNVFTVGIKSLVARKKQYLSLFLVCAFGVGVSLFCLFLVGGMLSSLENKAKIYYGGDFQFIGGQWGLDFSKCETFIEKVKPTFPEDTVISERFDLDADYSALYYEGTGVRQRVIKGIDFDKEQRLFSQFNFVEGDATDIAGTDGILLSKPIAEILETHVGDSITFLIKNTSGYTNTVQLIVKGIFLDSSLFGMYTSYMDLNCLRKVYGIPMNYANRICIDIADDRKINKKEIAKYQASLEQTFNMFKQVEDKQNFYDPLLAHKFTQPTYALIKLNANLQDLKILIDAMKGIIGFVIIMLVVIIVAGVSSTYRVIIMKRINEIGIYMAIGISNITILIMLLSEALFLILTGCCVGFLLSLIFCSFAGLFNFSFIPAFDIFLSDGVLRPVVSGSYFIIFSIVITVTTMCAVLLAIQKSVRITPVKALDTTE